MRLAGFAFLCLLACGLPTSGGAARAQAAPPADPVAALLNPGAQPVDEAERASPAPAPAEPEPEPPPAPSVRDLAYDSRLRASFAAAESFQGPLDGGWTLSAPGQGDLYGLQFSDRRGRVEGAWRDLRRRGPGSVGLIDDVARSGQAVVLTFRPEGEATPVTLALQGSGPRLTGALEMAGRRTPVTLRRTGP